MSQKKENAVEGLRIEYLSVGALKPAERNARKHTESDIQAIVESIKEFGFSDPIGIWGGANIIVEGHGRLLAAQRLGMTEVPCIRLDHLTDEQRRAYALAHNKTAELSDWDFSALEAELDDLKDAFNLAAFGFDVNAEPEVHEDDYEPVLPETPRAKRGDIWILGRHRLMCGDSTNADEVKKLVDGRPIDMLLTDPPYNVGLLYDESAEQLKRRKQRTDGLTIQNDKMDEDEFRLFLSKAFQSALSVMRDGAAFHIWHASSQGYNVMGACRDVGMKLRQVLIWCKGIATIGRQDFQWQHEPCLSGIVESDIIETEDPEACLYGWKDGTHKWYKKRREKTLLYFDKPSASKEHPTMKPVLMFDYEMQCNTKAGETVLDLFGGSGTTLIAAEQNGRDAFLMELDPKFCDVIVDRWQKLTGLEAVLLS